MIESILVQELNALLPMDVTDEGIRIEAILLHLENESRPIVFNLAGSLTLVSPVH